MQLTGKEISAMVFEENPEFSLELIREVDKFIFRTLRDKISAADTLVYNLPPLGDFNYRKTQTEKFLNNINPELTIHKEKLQNILNQYKVYSEDKLKLKYDKFGKENHEAYLLAKKEKNIQRRKEAESKKHI